ncbi:MAG TPA: ankyrin repeat domain-containing protein [Gammaproteobacteria bacterium]|nr:ankyrin repeat domain-containing protein [Gammaproteobacteria bacterium]
MANKRLIAGVALMLGLGAAGTALAASEVADAVMNKDEALLAKLLAQHVDVNAPQADGATGLHWAAYLDDLDAARALIKAGADPKAANQEGVTPLFLASQSGDAKLIELLLSAGADANETFQHGETPLMMAARTGNTAALDVLLKHGADVNAKEKLRGTTALMWAAAYSNPEAVKLLVEHGADLAARSDPIAPGRGPYLAPSARSRIEEAERGVGQAGRRVDAKKVGEGKVDFSDNDISDSVDPNGSPKQRQAERANAAGNDNAADDAGDAGDVGGDDGDGGGASARVDNGENEFAPPLPQTRSRDKWGGLTALVFAARQGDIESTKALVEAGADVNETTEYGWTPLLTAAQNRYYQLGKYLLDHGADPNIANKGGWTPLYIATDNRNIEGGDYPVRKPDMDHLDFIKLLLAKGADPNMRMKSSTETRTIFTHQWLYEEGATPFLRAAQSGDLVLMKLLVEHGANPNIPTDYNVTPLMVASGIGWVEGVTYEWSPKQTLETVKYLVDLGADVNAQDTLDGRTALMGAAHKGRSDVVQLLVDHGADLSTHDIGSRDSIHKLAGVTWQAIDYADGLVRVGVQSAVAHPETAALIRKLMEERGLPTPPAGRTLDSICVTPTLCQ